MSSSPAPSSRLTLQPERPVDAAVAERLIAEAFGPGRFAKTAERLREGATPDLSLSFIAWQDGEAVGCVRLWPIRIGGDDALLLGPIAVSSSNRSQGTGADLVHAAVEAARAADHRLILLVGDEAYFARAGFHPAPAGRVILPGPVDYRRVLWRGLQPGAVDAMGGAVTAYRS